MEYFFICAGSDLLHSDGFFESCTWGPFFESDFLWLDFGNLDCFCLPLYFSGFFENKKRKYEIKTAHTVEKKTEGVNLV